MSRKESGFAGILLLLITVVLVFLVLGYLFFSYKGILLKTTKEGVDSDTKNISQTTAPTKTADDFPPLYPGIKWTKVYEDADLQFINKEHEIVISKGTSYESEGLKNQPTEILKYFDQELTKRGWLQTETAGGPDGEIAGYQKGGNLCAIEYKALSQDEGIDRKIDSYKVFVYFK